MDDLQPVQLGHPVVEERDGRNVFADRLQRRASVADRGDDLDPAAAVQGRHDAVPVHGMVVPHDDADWSRTERLTVRATTCTVQPVGPFTDRHVDRAARLIAEAVAEAPRIAV